MALAYKRKQRAKTAAWTDSDSDGYLKRNDSDSDGDRDDRGRPSRGNTSKPSSRQMRQGSVSGQPESESGTIETRSESDTHCAECTSMPVSTFKTTMPVSAGRLPVSISKSQTPVCSLKSSVQYSVTDSRSCDSGILLSGCTEVSDGRWSLECQTAEVPVTRRCTTNGGRGQERKCRGAEKCQSESLLRKEYGIANRQLNANLYDTGSYSVKSTNPKNGVGVYSDSDRTQLVERHRSQRDSLYGHLDDLEETLGEMRSRGDSIVQFALSGLGTHLSLLSLRTL